MILITLAFIFAAEITAVNISATDQKGDHRTSASDHPRYLLNLEQIRKHNDISRKKFPDWIRQSDYNSALFSYGVAREHLSKVNKDVGGVVIIHDLVSFLGLQLERKSGKSIKYFEIGVSLGKCLFTQVNLFPPTASIVAVSISLCYLTYH
jgi:hypothetical protein